MFKRLIWLGIAIVCFLLAKNYLADYAKLQDLRQKNHTLSEKTTYLEQEIARLRNEEDRLMNDPEYIERRARSKLKLSKEGEIVLDIKTETE